MNRQIWTKRVGSLLTAGCWTVWLGGGGLGAQPTPDIVWQSDPCRDGVWAVSFSADGRLLASSIGRTALVWRVSTGELVASFRPQRSPWLTAVAFSPDGSVLGVGTSYGSAHFWRVTDGAALRSGDDSSDDGIYALVFSPDGRLVAEAQVNYCVNLYVAPPNPGRLDFYIEPPDETDGFDVRFSPDGRIVMAALSDHTAKGYRTSDGELVYNLVGHTAPVTGLDFSPDGRLVATVATDGDGRLWRMPEGTLERVIPGAGAGRYALSPPRVGRVRFSTDGESLLTVSNGTLRFWTVSDGRLLLSYSNLGAACMDVSPTGRCFAYGTTRVILARWPLLITTVAMRTNALHLKWQGGSGRYQVQTTSNVVEGPWEPLGEPTTNTSLTVPLDRAAPGRFFRVQSLPEGPQD